MNNYKDKTCETCIYRKGYKCHRFPPTIKCDYWNVGECYPRIIDEIDNQVDFRDACAEYKESD